MHINVSHILSEEIGESADFEIRGENPDIPDLKLLEPMTGRVEVTKLERDLVLKGRVHLSFELECYRCLDTYEHSVDLPISAVYSFKPEEDEWPISARGEIDLSPLVRQEALVSSPAKQLCKINCAGICAQCGQLKTDRHEHATEEIRHKPRIKKG